MKNVEYKDIILKMSNDDIISEIQARKHFMEHGNTDKLQLCFTELSRRGIDPDSGESYVCKPVFAKSINETEFDVFKEALTENNYWNAIIRELMRAEAKHPVWSKDNVYRAGILAEESGEVMRAAVQYEMEEGDIESIRAELIQTAAVCVRFLKAIHNQTGDKIYHMPKNDPNLK